MRPGARGLYADYRRKPVMKLLAEIDAVSRKLEAEGKESEAKGIRIALQMIYDSDVYQALNKSKVVARLAASQLNTNCLSFFQPCDSKYYIIALDEMKLQEFDPGDPFLRPTRGQEESGYCCFIGRPDQSDAVHA